MKYIQDHGAEKRVADTAAFEKKYANHVFKVERKHNGEVQFLGYYKSHDKALDVVTEDYNGWYEQLFHYFPFAFAYRSVIRSGVQEVFTFGSPRYRLYPVKLQKVANEAITLEEGDYYERSKTNS